jgi:hypothetical protein
MGNPLNDGAADSLDHTTAEVHVDAFVPFAAGPPLPSPLTPLSEPATPGRVKVGAKAPTAQQPAKFAADPRADPATPAALAARAAALRQEAATLRVLGPAAARRQSPALAFLDDESLLALADRAEKVAGDSEQLALLVRLEAQQHQQKQPPQRQKEHRQQQRQQQHEEPPTPARQAVPNGSSNGRANAAGTAAGKARTITSGEPNTAHGGAEGAASSAGSGGTPLRTTVPLRKMPALSDAPAAEEAAAAEAAAWQAAAMAHEARGRKAFTGKGYQEQHAAVAAAASARAARAAQASRSMGGGATASAAVGKEVPPVSLRQVWRRALYGPHADDPAASLGWSWL